MSIGAFVEKRLLKVRYIYRYPDMDPSDSSNVVSFAMDAPDEAILALENAARLAELVQQRRGDSAWRLYLYVEDLKIRGYSFLHTPVCTEWHDALPTHAGDARAASSFVDPAHRGRRIRHALFAEQARFCRSRDQRFWAVIEKSNRESLRASERSGGRRSAVNILIKVAGRNVVSFVSRPLALYLLYGRRRNRR